jgi:predicted naringenin-chalcone synthase
MGTQIIGLGTALPAGSLTQDEAVGAAVRLRGTDPAHEGARTVQLLNALYRRSGVKTRHSVLLREGNEDPFDRQTFYTVADDSDDRGPTTGQRMERFETVAPQLAFESCSNAIDDAGISADQIRHLVTVSCSGFAAPGFDLGLYRSLGLNPTTSRTHVGFMGCHGALNGIRVARAMGLANPEEPILLCATELCSLHHQYTDDPQQIVANSLFADGSAAIVIKGTEHSSKSNGRPINRWEVLANGSCVLTDTTDMMTWRVGDHGFQMTLSAQVPEVIRKQLRPWIEQWLAKQNVQHSDVDLWAVHPGGPRILTASADALQLDHAKLSVSTSILSECGNMSSPTILFILDRMQRQGHRGLCVALAFGPGLVVEAALLRR